MQPVQGLLYLPFLHCTIFLLVPLPFTHMPLIRPAIALLPLPSLFSVLVGLCRRWQYYSSPPPFGIVAPFCPPCYGRKIFSAFPHRMHLRILFTTSSLPPPLFFSVNVTDPVLHDLYPLTCVFSSKIAFYYFPPHFVCITSPVFPCRARLFSFTPPVPSCFFPESLFFDIYTFCFRLRS